MQSKVTTIILKLTRGTTAQSAVTEDAIIAQVMRTLNLSYIESKVWFEIALDELLDVEPIMSTLYDCKTQVTMLSGEQKRFVPCLYRG